LGNLKKATYPFRKIKGRGNQIVRVGWGRTQGGEKEEKKFLMFVRDVRGAIIQGI